MSLDFKNIEKALKITLPEHYTKAIAKYLKGTTYPENFIITDTSYFIEINQMLGFYGADKVVKHMLVIGENGGGDYYLINLKAPADQHIYVFDHEEVSESIDPDTGEIDWEAMEPYESFDELLEEISSIFG